MFILIGAHRKQSMASKGGGTAAAAEEAELKRRTGEFDLEAIFFLDLTEQGLSEVGAVPLCLSLRVLNLSCNRLRDVRDLSSLVSLEELDLSDNLITHLQDFDKLEKLQTLDLPGNQLSDLDTLLPLCGLPHLKSLSLRLPNTPSLSNPLCFSSAYDTFIAQSFPNLSWLDGEGVMRGGVRSERVELEKELEQLKAVGRACKGEEEEKDPMLRLSLDDDDDDGGGDDDRLVMKEIQQLLSDCRQTSQRVHDHIHSLRKEILN